tara:strand:- start:179 stop:322 length:144 start_codon:yes stop_codon:yes gene_type:complete
MLVLDIAEWIANFFILGIAALIWVIAVFITMALFSVIIERIQKYLVK